MKRVQIAHSQVVISSSLGISAPTAVGAQWPQGPLGQGEPQPGRTAPPGRGRRGEAKVRDVASRFVKRKKKKNVTRSHLPFSREGRGSPSGLPTPSCASEEMKDELIRIIIIIRKKKLKTSLRFVFLLLRLRPSLSAQDGTVLPLVPPARREHRPGRTPRTVRADLDCCRGPRAREGEGCAALGSGGDLGFPGAVPPLARASGGEAGRRLRSPLPRQRGSCVRAPGKETKREN